MAEKRNLVDLLLSKEPPAPRTVEIEIVSLTEHYGEPFILELKELGYSKLSKNKDKPDAGIHDILDSVSNMDLRGNSDLQEKFGVNSPVDLVKTIFGAGEITQIGRIISNLNGFAFASIEEIKKK